MSKPRKVKVVIWGFGAMGSGMAKMLLEKEGFVITGVCDLHPNRVNQKLSSVLNQKVSPRQDIVIQDHIESLVSKKQADIVLLATDSFTKGAFQKIKWILEQGVNVISTAEEMAYPYANEKELSKELDLIARKHKATVLGTGINPGMMMDYLVIALTGVMSHVENIEVSRVNSLSPFGETVMEEQGVGKTIEQYNELTKANQLAGHVGFKESTQMICDAIGWKISHFEQHMSPIITSVDRKSPHGFAKAGDVAGVDMRAFVTVNDEVKLIMKHPQQIEPSLGGVQTGDYITILGTPPVHMAIQPEIDGGIGTIAICVNMIPHVINSRPGLKTMLDLPVPRAIQGDVRDQIERK
jgi:2,4-diaminopentanoate dehydrogenase